MNALDSELITLLAVQLQFGQKHTFEKIHLFLNNIKCEETKSQIKEHTSYLAISYFYNYKPIHASTSHFKKPQEKIEKPNTNRGNTMKEMELSSQIKIYPIMLFKN